MKKIKKFVTCMLVVSFLAAYMPLTVAAVNPFLPLWEHTPDGEPRVFEYPAGSGQYRIFLITSHDTRFVGYCGLSIKAWSAPVENLTDWTDHGPIFTYQAPDGLWDIMFAPDLVEVNHRDGRREYFLFPHSRGPGREAMIASGPTPLGPFTILNLNEAGTNTLPGSVIGFDPHIYIQTIDDPEHPDYEIGFRAFAYWGFRRSWAVELDQTTMWSTRPGTSVIDYFIPSGERFGEIRDPEWVVYPHVFPGEDLTYFNHFEGKAVRRVGNKYVLTFSAYSGPEYNLGSSSSTMRYAFGDTPLGPWRMGGVLVDSRAPVLTPDGQTIMASSTSHNTHGAMEQINGHWYVFYHRAPRHFGYARQAMVAPLLVEYCDLPVAEGGIVRIHAYNPFAPDGIHYIRAANGLEFRGAQVTSEGFQVFGLPPYAYYSAGITSFLTRVGSLQDNWDIWDNHAPVTGVHNGDAVGFLHFGFGGLGENDRGLPPFEGTAQGNNTQFNLWLTPRTAQAFYVNVWLDGPWDSPGWDGTQIGRIEVPAGSAFETTRFTIDVSQYVDHLTEKNGLYLVAEGPGGVLMDLIGLGFSADHIEIERPVPPSVYIYVDGNPMPIPPHPVRATPENGIMGFDIYAQTVSISRNVISIPYVTAAASDSSVGITIHQADGPFGMALVEFDYDGVVKTYRVHLEPEITRLGATIEFIPAELDPSFAGAGRVAWEDVVGGFSPAGTTFQGVTSDAPGAVSFTVNVPYTGFYMMELEHIVHGGAAEILLQVGEYTEVLLEVQPAGWTHSDVGRPVFLNSGDNNITITHASGIFEVRSVEFRNIIQDETVMWAEVLPDGVISSIFENTTAVQQDVFMMIGVYNQDGVQVSSVVQAAEIAAGGTGRITLDATGYIGNGYYFRAFVLGRDFAPITQPSQGFIE
ncbi:MAG: hypothetical protein FWC78_00190 [Defluviitaleaceae bacterium]|nr:hypothetical protein [Defluviitaleaceae bacterium]